MGRASKFLEIKLVPVIYLKKSSVKLYYIRRGWDVIYERGKLLQKNCETLFPILTIFASQQLVMHFMRHLLSGRYFMILWKEFHNFKYFWENLWKLSLSGNKLSTCLRQLTILQKKSDHAKGSHYKSNMFLVLQSQIKRTFFFFFENPGCSDYEF